MSSFTRKRKSFFTQTSIGVYFDRNHNSFLFTVFVFMNTVHVFAWLDIDEDEAEDMMAYDCQREVLLFFKFYDPARRMIYYMGHSIEHIMSKFSKLV